MDFRIGVNLGEVIVEGDRIYGDGVNIAARVQALAEGGGVCISGSVCDEISSKLSFDGEPLGEQALKNIDEGLTAVANVPRLVPRPPALSRRGDSIATRRRPASP